MQNNRNLNDSRIDALDHALGRPTNPLAECSRNFFGVSVGSDQAAKMKADPYWTHTRDFMGTSGFSVSPDGKKALYYYLKSNWIPPKRYDVTWNGSTRNVSADKPSKAKYTAWLDMDIDLPFGEYVRTASARVAG